MSQLKVNALVSYSGNTVTLGTSGDTINVASNVTFNTSSNVVLPAGAAGTPSLTTQGDTNTGIFFPAADTIAFTEGGTEAMRIDSSGNVGIGVTSSGGKLDIKTAGTANTIEVATSLYYPNNTGGDASGPKINFDLNNSSSSRVTYASITALLNANTPAAEKGNLAFSTITSGTLAERIRINSVGNVQFAGNIGLGGTTPTTSGTGITFPATQSASTDANTLDDYEEGTFTPTVVGTSTAGTGTYSTQVGTYTKIGNRVYFSVYIVWSAHTGTGDMNMGGLPFTSNSNNFSPCAVVNSNIGLSSGYILSAWVVDSSTRVGLVQYPSGGGGNVGVALDTSATFAASGHYFI